MKLPGLLQQKNVRIVLAWLLPLVAAFVQWLLWPELAHWPWFLFFPAVIVAAVIGELPGGVGATLISVLLVTLFFLPRPATVQQDLGDVLAPLVFLATGIGFTLLYQRLRRSEERYHALFAGAGEGIVVIGKGGRFLDANDAYCAIVGRTRDEILHSSIQALGVDLAPETYTNIVQSLEAQGKATFEYRQRRPDGSVATMEATATTLRGGQVVAVVRDREEQRRMETALRQSEAKFVKLFDASPVPLIVSRLDNRHMVEVNTALVTRFGYSRDELIGRSTVDLSIIAPEARAALFEQLQRERRLADAELQVTCKDGTTRACLGYADIIELPGGPHMLISLIDITDRKRAERQLRDSEERFRLVVENSPSVILLWDEDGAIRYVSPALETTLGFPPATIVTLAEKLQTALQVQLQTEPGAQLVGLPSPERTAESLAERVRVDVRYVRAWLQALELARHCSAHPGEKLQVEEQMPHMAGDERSMMLTFQGFRRSSVGSEVVAVAHDITAHVALERLLAQTNAALEEQVAERTVELAASVARLEETLAELRRANAGKDAFMAAVSHELRTPLTAILSMAELLASERRGPLTADQARYVTTIEHSGRRLLATINTVVLYTQLVAGSEPLEPGPCRLAAVCDQAIRTVQEAAAAKQQHIAQAVVPPDLEMVTDPRGLINILHMLLDNAVKFTPPGGAIVVEVAPVPPEMAPEALAGAGENRCVTLTVADTGVGMSPAEMDGIFSAFMQGDLTLARRFDGLGLGLAYVREMTARLGGTVTVASEVDRGARFTVTLPLIYPFPEG